MSGYGKAAKSYRGGEAREDYPHGRTERKRKDSLLPLAPAMDDNNTVFNPRSNHERHKNAVGQIQIDPEKIHQAQGPCGPNQKGYESHGGGLGQPGAGQRDSAGCY